MVAAKLVVVGLLLPVAAVAAEYLVRIDDVEITHAAYEQQAYVIGRQTFYHGKPLSDDELLEFRRRVVDDIVARELLLREARRRGMQADRQFVDGQLSTYEARYAGTERWQAEGDAMLARLRDFYEQESLLAQLDAKLEDVGTPDGDTLADYYAANIDKFTEPAQQRVSVILFPVAPSADGATWQAARDEAQRVAGLVGDGRDFAELARQYSADVSSEKGGDMGYLHEGMLSPAAESVIDKLDIGEVSAPVDVLEGVAVFRVTDRTPAAVRHLDDVRERAADLWARDAARRAKETLTRQLRAEAVIDIDEEYLQTLPANVR